MQFKGVSLWIVITVIVGGSLVVSAQQDMQNMPGMKMGNKGTQKDVWDTQAHSAKEAHCAKEATHYKTYNGQYAGDENARNEDAGNEDLTDV